MKSELEGKDEMKRGTFAPPVIHSEFLPSSSSGRMIGQITTFSCHMKYMSPGLRKQMDDLLKPKTGMDIFAYTLPDRINHVFLSLHSEVGRLIKQFQEFYSSINTVRQSDKHMAKQHRWHREALMELLTCIKEMMNYVSSVTLMCADAEDNNVLTPLIDLLTAFIKHYDDCAR